MRGRFLALGACLLLVAGCGGGATGVARRAPVAATSVAPHLHGSDVDPSFDRFTMGSCAPSAPPLGAIPPTPPAWCGPLVAGKATARVGVNSWVDLFDNGLDHASFPDAYKIFEAARPSSRILRTKHFLHNGHWMVDVAGEGAQDGEYEDDRDVERADQNWGGALMRPDRTFRFDGGRLVVEFDVAAGMLAYHDGWPEVIVTAAPRPTGVEVDPIHAIGVFGGAATVGCRLYADRTSNCSAYDSSGRAFDRGGRLFDLSATSDEGAAAAFGGAPKDPSVAAAWRLCAPSDPDTNCRDRFRVEIARDAVRLFVNGTLYMAHTGLPAAKQLPRELLEGDLYVYFASWVYLGKAETERFHWGRIAINP